jgi:hypothetical protein
MNPTEVVYTVPELAAMHKLCRNTIINIYEKEEGVRPLIRIRNGRTRRTFRIPHHVYLRVIHKMESGKAFV